MQFASPWMFLLLVLIPPLVYLRARQKPISRFVLLDHMDWLSTEAFNVLEQEWQAILSSATPDARILWRSGGLQTDYIDRVTVDHLGQRTQLTRLLEFDAELAADLHRRDRVHTYGSFYIADLSLSPALVHCT